MWPIPALERELITISFSSKNLCCSWIQKTKRGSAPLVLRAYERHELHNLELEHLTLFNPTKIKYLITSFVSQHKKSNAFVAFSFHGSGITEKLIAHTTSTPQRADFGVPHSSNVLWDYRYLYPNDNNQFIFYLYAIPRLLLLQYELLAIAAHLNVIAMTTQHMALLSAYKYMFGAAFRKSQLGIDMMHHHNNYEKLISPTILARMITIPPTIRIQDELTHLATACGLFTAEGLL
jgi:hypothetical protein